VNEFAVLPVSPGVFSGTETALVALTMSRVTELRVVEGFFAVDLPGKPIDTASLWIMGHTEYISGDDEKSTFDNPEVRIIEASDRSIDQVNIRAAASAETKP